MTNVRRRVLRPQSSDAESRWMSRLKRAFHAMEKLQTKIARLERQVEQLEAEPIETAPE